MGFLAGLGAALGLGGSGGAAGGSAGWGSILGGLGGMFGGSFASSLGKGFAAQTLGGGPSATGGFAGSPLGGQAAGWFMPNWLQAAAGREARYGQVQDIFNNLIGQYSREGSYQQGLRNRLMGTARQGAVSSGLYGSTIPSAIGVDIDRQIEDARQQMMTNLMLQKAEYTGGYEPYYMDIQTLAGLLAGGRAPGFQKAFGQPLGVKGKGGKKPSSMKPSPISAPPEYAGLYPYDVLTPSVG